MKTIPLFKVFMHDDAKSIISAVLDSGYIGQGPKSEEFEKLLKYHFNNDNAILLNSCTSALQLALHMIKTSDDRTEVISTPLTCFATISSIIANGLGVKWADVADDCNIDLLDVKRKLTNNTLALMLVHWGGNPVDLDEVERIKIDYRRTFGRDLFVIEDCAHCWDSKWDGNLIGNSGNYCCFSFQAIKFLTTGDGGLLITPDSESCKRGKLLRWFGLDRDSGASFRCVQDIKESGFKYQCNDVISSMGLANYSHVVNNVKIHCDNAAFYNKELLGIDNLCILRQSNKSQSSYWLYTILVDRRNDFIRHMTSCGIETSPVHARCDKHSCVDAYARFLPGMDYLETRMVCIPCGWWVSYDDRKYIIDCIRKGW